MTVSFAPNQASEKVTVRALQDFRDEPDQAFTIDLAGHTGDLMPGSPGRITIIVVDDDRPAGVSIRAVRSLKVKRGKVKIKAAVTGTGRLRISVTDRRGRLLGRSRTAKITRPVTATLPVKLNARGRAALKRANRRKGLRVKLYATLSPDDLPTPLTSTRGTTLKR